MEKAEVTEKDTFKGSEKIVGKAEFYKLGVLLGALSALGPLAIDMYLPSFPAISRELGVEISSVELTVAVYFIGLALGQAVYGPISDRIGRKIPLYFGLVTFIVASILCAFATGIEMLIACRFLQALGGCAEMVVARAIVRDRFDQKDSVKVLSFLMLIMGVAPILAPLIGGQLLTLFGWRAIFWTLAISALLCLLASIFFLEESLPEKDRNKKSVGEILSVYAFLFKDLRYLAYVLSGSLIMAGMFGYIAGSPFVFMEIFGVSPENYGFFFGANALGLITASQINGRLARTIDSSKILRVVLTVTAIAGLTLLTTAVTGFGGFVGILIPLFFFVASLGFILPNTTAAAMAPHGKIAGSASALLGTIQFLVGAGAGAVIGNFNNGTALPLAGVIAFCGVSAWLIYFLFVPKMQEV